MMILTLIISIALVVVTAFLTNIIEKLHTAENINNEFENNCNIPTVYVKGGRPLAYILLLFSIVLLGIICYKFYQKN